MKSSTAHAFFLAAFPGYFFYHVMKSTVNIPYIGWFSAVLIFCTGISLIGYVLIAINRKLMTKSWPITIPFLCLIIVMSVTILANHLLNNQKYITVDGAIANTLALVWMIALFQIGRSYDFSGNGITFLLLITVFAVCTWVFYDPDIAAMYLPVLPDDNFESANYQGMARSVFCASVMMIPFLRGRWFRTAMMIATCVTLYFIGSRTELIMFVMITPIFALINFKAGSPLLITAAAILMVGFLMFSGIDIVERSSQYATNDASLNERSVFLSKGIDGIEASPIMGDYLGQVRDFGATGYYIHNILSVWQQFGLFSFLLYAALCLGSLYIAIILTVSGKITPHIEALLYLSLTCLIGVLTTKSMFWPLPAMAWGLAARTLAANTGTPSKQIYQI